MEQEIKQLIELAKNYRDFGIKYKLPSGFTVLGEKIRIYFANGRSTCSIEFHGVEVKLYGSTIEIPFQMTGDKLLDILYRCSSNLSELKKEYAARPKNETEKARIKRIQELESELKELQKPS